MKQLKKIKPSAPVIKSIINDNGETIVYPLEIVQLVESYYQTLYLDATPIEIKLFEPKKNLN